VLPTAVLLLLLFYYVWNKRNK